jgi:hypothetical protein
MSGNREGSVMANSEKSYQHWIEIVRTFRTYYDHFRIAFPHMHQIPKFFSDEWASEFRMSAREFARKEDMHAVKQLFDGVGYGSERWTKLMALPPESISSVLGQIIPPNGSPIALVASSKTDRDLSRAREALGDTRFDRLMEDPEAFARELDRLESEKNVDDGGVGTDSPEAEVAPDSEVEEAEPIVIAGTIDAPVPDESPAGGVDDSLAHVIDVLGETRWQSLLDDPEAALRAMDGADDVDGTEAGDLASSERERQEEAAATIKALEENNDNLAADLETATKEKRDVELELKRIQTSLDEKEREFQALGKKVKSLEEKVKEAEDQKGRADLAKLPPTKLSQQLEEYEKIVKRSEVRIAELEEQTEKDEIATKEMMEDLKREKFLQQKFEDDLEGARTALREQIDRLHSVLKGDPEIPSLDEFEQMENDELLGYIEDVEKEKQRVMAGFDAIDVQEESYKKQIDVQQEEMGAIQEDIQNMKGSTLAMEVEEMKETVEKQRSQLQKLMGYSKNLKTRCEQANREAEAHKDRWMRLAEEFDNYKKRTSREMQLLAERQDPMRRLVQKLNLQEKALVRYVRLNYDNKFMPEKIY